MTETFITDKHHALVLWRRLRISYYVNTVAIAVVFSFAFLRSSNSDDGALAAIVVMMILASHFIYHHQLGKVTAYIGKSSNWWFLSFITFPFGPLISYHVLKPAAMRSGVPFDALNATRAGSQVSRAWLARALSESANLVEFRQRFVDRYGENLISSEQIDELYEQGPVTIKRAQRPRVLSAVLSWLALHPRRAILGAAATLYLISVACAPWSARGSERTLQDLMDSGVSLLRFSPIFSPPGCADPLNLCHYELNVPVLIAEWIFIAILAGIAWLWIINKE